MKILAGTVSAIVVIGVTSMAHSTVTAVDRQAREGQSDARAAAALSDMTRSYELPTVVVRGVRPTRDDTLPTVVVSAPRNRNDAGPQLMVPMVMGLFAAVLWRMRRRAPTVS